MAIKRRRTLSSRRVRGRPSRIILPHSSPAQLEQEEQEEQEEERRELPTHVDPPLSNVEHPLHSGFVRMDARCKGNMIGSSSKARPLNPIQQNRTPLEGNYNPSLDREVDRNDELLFSLVPPLRNVIGVSSGRTISTNVDGGSRSTRNEGLRSPSLVQPHRTTPERHERSFERESVMHQEFPTSGDPKLHNNVGLSCGGIGSSHGIGGNRMAASVQASGPRDHGQQQFSTPLQQHRATLVRDDINPSPASDEATEGQPTNDDPPSHNNVDASEIHRRGRNRGTDEPADRHLRTFIHVLGKSFVPQSVVAEISATVGYHLHGSWKSWSQYPQYMKQKLWENFKSKYKWAAGTTRIVYDTWWDVADRRLRDRLAKERKIAQIKTKSSNPLDWRSHGPDWIGEKIWNKLCEDHWSKKEFQSQSKAGKKNRNTLKDGTISTHTGGSKSFAAHKEDMKKEQGREISEIEIYERTHRSKQGLGEYSCRKAKAVREMYDDLVEEKYASDPTSMPPFDPNLWREAIGGAIKGRVYGFGSQDPSVILGNAAAGGSKAQQRESYTCLEEDLNERFAHLEKIVDQMEARNEQLVNQQRAMVSALESHLPDAVRRMLQDIHWTNHTHAGGSGHQEQEFLDSVQGNGRHGRSDCDSNRNDNRNNMRNSDKHNRDDHADDMSD